MPNAKRSRKLLQGIVSLLVIIPATTSLTACYQNSEVSMLSEESLGSSATLPELHEWVSDEVDAVIQVTGTDQEWRALGVKEVIRWSTSRDEILEGFGRTKCTATPDQPDPAAVVVYLITDPLEQDPFVMLERTRKMWVDRGWEVGTLAEAGGERQISSIVARREDRALLTLDASDAAGGKLLSLSVSSPCSTDPSVLR